MHFPHQTIVAALSLDSVHHGQGDARQCCRALTQGSLRNSVYYPHTSNYNARLASYWSADAALAPWCMVLPSNTMEVSFIMKALTDNECPFGIRSGGHGAWAGVSSVSEGVTVDFGHMNQTAYDRANRLASIQPGANWGSVYDKLTPHGVTVTGGRSASVGVGGFVTGGGNSFHAALHGFACDNVANFEVVLADGRVVNANATSHPDLATALKGGSGNFGLVTRFDMYAIPFANPAVPHIWGGTVSYDLAVQDRVVDAYINFAENIPSDLSSSVIMWWNYNPAAGGMALIGCLDNVANVPHAPAFKGFLGAGGIKYSTLRSNTMSNITGELSPPGGERNIWMTSAYKNDARVIRYVAAQHEKLVAEIDEMLGPNSGLNTLMQFQPITTPLVAHGATNGGNVLGLEARVADGPGFVWLIFVALHRAEDEAKALPLVRRLQQDVENYARSIGADWDWHYLNYADKTQQPIQSYGKAQVRMLRDASARYDPHGVFQKLRGSGFKIPAK
ncbi:FAD binding domain-containing protein [Xylariomycetidae sp. FL0641]|nr:FAD binding domain-containing protein [Xylariomycetidae sp. FL0641]